VSGTSILVPYLWVALGFNLASTGHVVRVYRLRPPPPLRFARALWLFGAVVSVGLASFLWPVLLYFRIREAMKDHTIVARGLLR